jgi:hypothetical protein
MRRASTRDEEETEMNKAIPAISLIIASVVAPAQTVGTATISGTIVGDSGRPLAGAKLVYTRMVKYARDPHGRLTTTDAGVTDSVTVGTGGAFVLPALPAGSYFLCAYGPRPDHVSGCHWDGGHAIELANGQTVQNIVRTVHDGTIVTIRVNDPNGRIVLPDAKGNVRKERRFFMGVTVPSGYCEPAMVLSSAAGQVVFQVAIPNQQKVRFNIDSELSVSLLGSDLPSNNVAAGAPLETGRPTTFQIVPAGRSQVTVDLGVK